MRLTKQIAQYYRVLAKSNSNIVDDILRYCGKFYEWQHYPEDDVYDHDSHCQYYYHAHPQIYQENFTSAVKEHGHFHLFIRKKGIPKSIRPLILPSQWQQQTEDFCHLIAIAMNHAGFPIRLFTVNRWVTGETWYKAKSVIKLLKYFVIDHAWPSWPANLWLTAMVKLHQRDIATLLIARDQVISSWHAKHPNANPFEEHSLEVLSFVDINHLWN